MNEINQAVEIFEKNGIKTRLNKDNKIIISHYTRPKDESINENDLIKNVIACEGLFDTKNSLLTEFPLVVAREIRLYDDTKITEMPELKAAGIIVLNKTLKKLPKLKAVGSISLEDSMIKSLPKLKEAGILIAQNSKLKELPSLKKATKLCIIDCPVEDLKELEEAEDIFLCSSDENNKIKIINLANLKEVNKLFAANTALKSLPKLKKAQKIALYNCEVKSLKLQGAEIEIKNHISDSELSEKFDTFTDWYNSDILEKSMDLLGSVVNLIQS